MDPERSHKGDKGQPRTMILQKEKLLTINVGTIEKWQTRWITLFAMTKESKNVQGQYQGDRELEEKIVKRRKKNEKE